MCRASLWTQQEAHSATAWFFLAATLTAQGLSVARSSLIVPFFVEFLSATGSDLWRFTQETQSRHQDLCGTSSFVIE